MGLASDVQDPMPHCLAGFCLRAGCASNGWGDLQKFRGTWGDPRKNQPEAPGSLERLSK